MKSLNRIKLALSVSLLGVIVACSSNNANDPLSDQVVVVMTDAPNDGPLIVTTDEQMATDSAAAIDMLNGTDFAPPGDPAGTMLAVDTGDLVPAVFASQTELDMVYAQAGAALIRSFNEAIALPADIALNFIDCGTANALSNRKPHFLTVTGQVHNAWEILPVGAQVPMRISCKILSLPISLSSSSLVDAIVLVNTRNKSLLCNRFSGLTSEVA